MKSPFPLEVNLYNLWQKSPTPKSCDMRTERLLQQGTDATSAGFLDHVDDAIQLRDVQHTDLANRDQPRDRWISGS